MELPSTLDQSLSFCSSTENDEGLFKILHRNPPQLIQFIAEACEDETWVLAHSVFFKRGLQWLTEQFFQDRLLMEFAQLAARALRKHYNKFKELVPLNLTLKLKDRELQVNSLLLGSSSEYLRETIRRECRDKKHNYLMLKEVPYSMMSTVIEFVNEGTHLSLYHKEKNEIYKTLNLAMLWDLRALSDSCQEFLVSFIDRDNVISTMLKAHQRGRGILRKACFEYINDLKLNCRFEERRMEDLAFEFIKFTENSMEIFNQSKEEITHLIFSGNTIEEAEFVIVINACPKLICLDISGTVNFSENLKEVPDRIRKLEARACFWMTNQGLKTLIQTLPNLNELTLSSSVKIDFEGWGRLKDLKELRSLDLTRCSQIQDEDLRLILQASPELIALTLEECRSIGDAGFLDIPVFNNGFVNLNFARTFISSLPLIEIATKCDLLTSLNIMRCEYVNADGIKDVVRVAKNLREINISGCDVSQQFVQELRKIKPYLKIISDF